MDALLMQPQDLADAKERVRGLSNDDLIIELINTLNHLSRWLTPIHDWALLDYSPIRSEPSVKDLLITMRDTETRAYALMYAIAIMTNPDLDRIPQDQASTAPQTVDRSADALVIMASFRRVRESSSALLRALPDNAWQRGGYSRTRRNWTIRELGEFLAIHDWRMLTEIDRALARSGAREGIAEVSQVDFGHIDEPFLLVTRCA
ncbi:MAG: hypothetical protein H0T18_00785 [Chloroflexia bacterium]|nr:hypothetical protein [Chloroflexia bacterium]